MPVISVINYKGGVGKTTLTSNLAADLAMRNYKVLMIDLDPQANLTFSFITEDDWQTDYQEHLTIKSWFDAFVGRDQIMDLSELVVRPERFYRKVKAPLDLICSHLGLINVDLDLAVMLGGATLRRKQYNFLRVHSLLAKGLNNLINGVAKNYDFVLIDCPPNFNIVTKNALVASDYYLIPAKPDFLSTLGIGQLKKHVNHLITEFNSQAGVEQEPTISPGFLGVVFTMLYMMKGEPILTQKQYINQTRSNGFPIFKTQIRENKSIYGGAPQYGIPVVCQPGVANKDVKTELKSLTDELLKRVCLDG